MKKSNEIPEKNFTYKNLSAVDTQKMDKTCYIYGY